MSVVFTVQCCEHMEISPGTRMCFCFAACVCRCVSILSACTYITVVKYADRLSHYIFAQTRLYDPVSQSINQEENQCVNQSGVAGGLTPQCAQLKAILFL